MTILIIFRTALRSKKFFLLVYTILSAIFYVKNTIQQLSFLYGQPWAKEKCPVIVCPKGRSKNNVNDARMRSRWLKLIDVQIQGLISLQIPAFKVQKISTLSQVNDRFSKWIRHRRYSIHADRSSRIVQFIFSNIASASASEYQSAFIDQVTKCNWKDSSEIRIVKFAHDQIYSWSFRVEYRTNVLWRSISILHFLNIF